MPQEMLAMYDTLTDVNKQAVLSYTAFLIQEQQKAKNEEIKQAFEKIHELLSAENPWNSEEEMLEELANDRRRRMGLVK